MPDANKLTLVKLYKYFIIALTGKDTDFTTGSIRKAIFMLSIPMVLEMLMESIFALVDIAYVSRVSVNAVATIGLTESVITLIYALAIGLSMAATAIVARRVGEKNLQGARESAVQVIILGITVAIITGIFGAIYSKEILGLMGGSSELIQEGHGYTQLMIGGNISILLLFLINAIFRGAGDASVAMWILVLSNGLNIILDPIFIFGWGPITEYGVMGAAIATNIGRGTAVLFQLIILFFGWSKIKISISDIVIRFKVMTNIIKVSAGGIAQFLIGTSSWIFLMRIMSEFGSEVLAGYTIAIRVIMFSLMPSWGMSNAAATLVGQNLGANAIFMFSISLIYLFFAENIILSFNNTPQVVEYGTLCLQIIAAGYVFYAYGMVLTQAFNGAGDTNTPTKINLLIFWVLQLPFAYIMAMTFEFGAIGVFLAISIAEVLLTLVSYILFKKGKWKEIKV